MPTDTRLLYLLADLAYVAKLIPAKKAHDFVLADFRQINGEFLDENILLEANLAKLFSKLEAGSYKLVLPDFLFTSTIVNLELANEEAVKTHLKEKLLPELNIDQAHYYLDTTVLSNYKGVFKVQLTALEKSVVAPLAQILQDHQELKIESISPLSWTSKSIISLEPSVAILQMGDHLFLAEHYIGVDQCYAVPVAEGENFAETVKTLKGAEPSLQTVYLLTNSLVDDAIKEKLKATLPVQQLADLASENESMPSYVRQIIEAGAKTFAIPEFLLPKFSLDKNYRVDEGAATSGSAAAENERETDDDDEEEDLSNLVKPAVVGAAVLPSPILVSGSKVEVAVENLDEDELQSKSKAEPESESEPELESTSDLVAAAKSESQSNLASTQVKEVESEKEEKEIDFSQFANLALDPSVFDKNQITKTPNLQESTQEKVKQNMSNTERQVIKNPNDGSSVGKMIIIGFLSFLVTIALGVGIGLAYLHWTNQQIASKPVVEVEPSPTLTITPTATPTPSPTIDKTAYKILVVNATTKAGYASAIVNKIKAAKFENVNAKNAKGIYDKGDYLLVKTEDASSAALLKELETATALSLNIKTSIQDEDSANAYDAVVVLGQ